MNHLIDEYTRGYDLINQALKDVTDEELFYRTNENSWTIKEVVIHLADSETVVVYRIKKIISEGIVWTIAGNHSDAIEDA